MTDDPKRERARKLRQHEVNVKTPAHPGEPKRLISNDHEVDWHEPAPGTPRRPQTPSDRDPG